MLPDLPEILELLSSETLKSLQSLRDSKDLTERSAHAEIVQSLVQSFGTIIETTTTAMEGMGPEFFEADEEDFEFEDED